jgi:hypothetical protein
VVSKSHFGTFNKIKAYCSGVPYFGRCQVALKSNPNHFSHHEARVKAISQRSDWFEKMPSGDSPLSNPRKMRIAHLLRNTLLGEVSKTLLNDIKEGIVGRNYFIISQVMT